MKPQVQQFKKQSSVPLIVCLVSLLFTIIGIAGIVAFVNFNNTIKVADGKVVDTFTQKEFASKKQTFDQEYDVVCYHVDGKEYRGKTIAPKSGSSYIPVYYYEKYPQWAWYKSRENSGVFFSALFAAIFAIVGVVAIRVIVKRKAEVKEAGKVAGKKSK